MENCLREDLKPIEQARAFRALIDRRGYSYRQLSEHLHVAPASVARALALLELPEDLQGRVEAGELAPSVAYEVSRLKSQDDQRQVAERVVSEDLNRAEAVEAVRQAAGRSTVERGRGAIKARPKRPTVETIRTTAARVTVEFRKAVDPTEVLAALREAVAKWESKMGRGVTRLRREGVGEHREPEEGRVIMPRQYVSFCGHSGVGKKTLMKMLVADEPPGLRERFGITGSVGAYGLPGQTIDLGEIIRAREETVLHFWQDSRRDWIEKLRQTFPEDIHRIILLWRPWDSHSAALLARNTPGYRPSPADVAANWREMRMPEFRKFEADGFEVELINGETHEPMSEWPS